jgi:hypothetical protein
MDFARLLLFAFFQLCCIIASQVDPTRDDFVCSIQSLWGPVGWDGNCVDRDPSISDEVAWIISPVPGTIRSINGPYLAMNLEASRRSDSLECKRVEDLSNLPDTMRFDIINGEDGQFIIRSRADQSLALDAEDRQDGFLVIASVNGKPQQSFIFHKIQALVEYEQEYCLRKELILQSTTQFTSSQSCVLADLQSVWGSVGASEDQTRLIRGPSVKNSFIFVPT